MNGTKTANQPICTYVSRMLVSTWIAKNTTAIFTKIGTYHFQVTITDAGGLSVTSSVSVTVSQTDSSVTISPTATTVSASSTRQFFATSLDQGVRC